jgi:hypothetical protein
MDDTLPRDLGARLEPFLDDYLIAALDGCSLVMHHPHPEGLAVAFDEPWEGRFAACITVLHDGDVYRMYYRGKPELSPDGEDEVTCYAESADGCVFHKPHLDLSPAGYNVILDGTSGVGHNFAPFIDTHPDCSPEERYKAMAGLHGTGVFAFTSGDGIHWRELADEPVITSEAFAFDSQNVSFWSETEGCYLFYFRTWKSVGEGGYRWVSRSCSPDMRHWSDPVEMDTGDAPLEHLYTQQTHPYFRAPHIYLSLAARFWPDKVALTQAEADAIDVHSNYWHDISDGVLMSSRGGHVYDRTFLESFIRPGMEPGNWVSRTNYPGLGVVPTGPAEMSLYAHCHYAQPTCHAARYSLRTDGFASVNAPYAGGEMLTHPLRFAGARLVLNVATSAAGELRVEIQDEAGQPLPGYALADCLPIYTDEIERAVAWTSGADVGALAGQTVRLRFSLKDADLFSLRFAP